MSRPVCRYQGRADYGVFAGGHRYAVFVVRYIDNRRRCCGHIARAFDVSESQGEIGGFAWGAHTTQAVVCNVPWAEHVLNLGAEFCRHGLADASGGAVERCVGAVNGHTGCDCRLHCKLCGCAAGNVPEAAENQRVVRYHKVAAQRHRFRDCVGCHVEAYQHSGYLVASRRKADLQSGVVPAFLKLAGCEPFEFPDYVVQFHSSAGAKASCSSSSCFWSSAEGASSITSRPLLFLGKAMQSRMLSRPAKRLTQRSRP